MKPTIRKPTLVRIFTIIIIAGIAFLSLSDNFVSEEKSENIAVSKTSNTIDLQKDTTELGREQISRLIDELEVTAGVPAILATSTENLPNIGTVEDVQISSSPPFVFIKVPEVKITPVVQGGLAIEGNKILDNGVSVTFKGISVGEIGDLTWRDLNEEYRKMSEDWNANMVRISVHPKYWRDDPSGSLQLIKDHIAVANSYGMYVIVDYHVIGWPDGYYEPAWGGIYVSDFNIAMDFWSDVSREIEGDNIIFELWNEPVYWEGETELSNNNHWPELKSYFEQMINVIRANDNNSIVLATGGSWSYDLRGIKDDPIDDPRVAYTWHCYAGNGGNDPNVWEIAMDGLYNEYPVIVTEWGFEPDAYDKHWYGNENDYGYKFINMMDNNGLSSVAWNWNPYYGPPLTELDWITPTVLGQFVKDYYQE